MMEFINTPSRLLETDCGSKQLWTIVCSRAFVCLSILVFASSCYAVENATVIVLAQDGKQIVLDHEAAITKSLLKTLEWRYADLYMADCFVNEDCAAGARMICRTGRCLCNVGDVLLEVPKFGCFPKAHIFAPCEVSGQCTSVNPNTYCNPSGRCTCSLNYYFNGRECILRYDGSNLKAQEVYKAAVVAAACFIVAVVGIFVACIVRRSFCRREQHLQQSDSNRESDIFSVSDEIAALRAVDKPPSYEEVLQIERTFYGIPPPEYTVTNRNDIVPPSLHMATSCASVQTTSPDQSYVHESLSLSDVSYTTSLADGTTLDASKGSDHMLAQSHATSGYSSVADGTNFLATAEVLPMPSEQNENSVADSVAADTIVSHYVSSTLPSCHHHRHHASSHGSVSLPGSPNLKSRAVVDTSVPQRKLIKQNTTSHLTSSACNEASSSQVSLSPPDDNCSSAPVAYDNPGFIADTPDSPKAL